MTFASVYEMFDPITTVRKQRFWEWFSGDALRSIWTQTNIAGTGTFAMADGVDLGFDLRSGSGGANNESQINFNNKRHYAHDGAICIMTFRVPALANTVAYGGFTGNILTYNGVEKAVYICDSADTNFALSTADASTSSDTEGSVTRDTSWHSVKIENGSANIKLTIDGTLDVTKTTNRPTAKMQPVVGNLTKNTSAQQTYIRYLETYNT